MNWILLPQPGPQAETEKVMGLGPIVACSDVDVKAIIENELAEMGKSAKIDDKIVANTLQTIGKQLQSVAGIHSLMGRRKPTFTYCVTVE
eukprot:2679773-Amphidinium_carterae.10